MQETYVEYHYHTAEAMNDDQFIWQKVAEILVRYTPAPCRIFEIGCGNGYSANRLLQMGYEVTGIDPSKSGIAHGQRSYPALRLHEGSVYDDLSTEYGQFPVVLSLEVIEHCYEPRTFARRVNELLEPGGIGILSTPYHGYWKNLALALFGRFDQHFSPLWDGGHIKFFSVKTLSSLLREAGFEDLQIHRVGRVPSLAKSMVAVFRKPGLAPGKENRAV
jgi:2-polyprenyl-6-hydroxyphenyl methylase/3-demethylubiquinone-9 3-methyltransferase